MPATLAATMSQTTAGRSNGERSAASGPGRAWVSGAASMAGSLTSLGHPVGPGSHTGLTPRLAGAVERFFTIRPLKHGENETRLHA
ncbi:hypothetical protein mvi_59810 [Methylobacterium indicum]|uniref:Uncharacterized protein n=1 Tax=Methylobacterium indicum TaxID=1775910 RepID=A0A8H8WZF4_9HYPH|nr:hypothetical protein mvi_59810 [Methylobacterium indicum]